jgi:hypothetical protein
VVADGPGDWSLTVPALVARDPATEGPLLRLLQSLRVTRGSAGFALNGTVLQLEGRENATFEASVAGGPREAFGGWGAPEPDLARRDATGPPTSVTWAVDFSGGTGHTCWARETWTVNVAANETRPLVGDAPIGVPERPWRMLCA